jgi:hypothetical protein
VRIRNANKTIEIDAEVGRLSDDLEASRRFREQTAHWTKFCLGLSDKNYPTPDNRIIAFFKVIGDANAEACTWGEMSTMSSSVHSLTAADHRVLIQKELEFFMETSESGTKPRCTNCM